MSWSAPSRPSAEGRWSTPTRPWLADFTVDCSTACGVLERAVSSRASADLSVLGEGWDNLVVAVDDDLLLRLPRRHLGA